MPIAPGTKPKLAVVGSGIHDVEPTVMVYQSAVRDPDLLITSGQYQLRDPSADGSGAPYLERLRPHAIDRAQRGTVHA